MERRISRTKFRIYALDFETHNDVESLAKRESSVWLGSFIDDNSKVDDEESYIYSVEELLNKLEFLSTPKRKKKNETRQCKNLAIYVYNLSFEWSFILPKLLERGFEFKETILDEDEFKFNSITTQSVSSVWMITIKFHKKSGKIIFRDLSKIFGGGLGKVAKSFNLETQKGEIDYRLNRLHGWNPTKEEKEYCFKDTKIVMDILSIMNDKNDKNFWNSSSCATYSMKMMIEKAYPNAIKPYQEFRKEYPALDEEESEFLRKSVEGGLTYPTKEYQFKDIQQKQLHIDVHQQHPSQGYKHLFPYGRGEYFVGKPPHQFNKIACCRIKISYVDKKLDSLIKLINIPFTSEMEIVVWDFEIPTMYKIYEDLTIEYIDGFEYKCKFLKWRNYYLENYEKRKIAKQNGDLFNVMFYKLLNNSSYGKLLEKPHNCIFKNTLNEYDIITSDVEYKSENDIKDNAKYTYIPVGSCIPAYSRVYLIETALKFGHENITYMDTDSLFILWNEKTKKVWETIPKEDKLGDWGLEEFIERSQYTAPKRYKKIDDNGKTDVKMAGINNIIGDYEEVNIVDSTWKVQRAFRCKGGTLIDFQEKHIQVQEKYQNRYINNTKK